MPVFGIAKTYRRVILVIFGLITLTTNITEASAKCDTYMYPKNGVCIDARHKVTSNWMNKLDWNFNSSRW